MTATVLLLAHATDAGAAAVAVRLMYQFGPQSVLVLRPEVLALARWSHRIRSNGRAETHIKLPDGREVASGAVRVLLNRIQLLPVVRFGRASPKDRDYACAEVQALVASWLAELDVRAIPSARRHPCVVPSVPALRWQTVAAALSLPVARQRTATSSRDEALWVNATCHDVKPVYPNKPALHGVVGSVVVAGDEAGGVLASKFGARCTALADHLGFPLLECRFKYADREHVLAAVDPIPSLQEHWAVDIVSRFLVSLSLY